MGAVAQDAAILGPDGARRPGEILARQRPMAGFLQQRIGLPAVSLDAWIIRL